MMASKKSQPEQTSTRSLAGEGLPFSGRDPMSNKYFICLLLSLQIVAILIYTPIQEGSMHEVLLSEHGMQKCTTENATSSIKQPDICAKKRKD